MASRVLSSNYRLSSTSKLWSNNTKKKHQFKVLKLNLFFTSFLYRYLMLMNSQILFSYFFYFYSLSWYIDLFVFRGLTDVFTRKERTARFKHIWTRQKLLFHKVRRPYSVRLHQFILQYVKGFIKKSRFNNKLLLGKLKTSLHEKKELNKQWYTVIQKIKRVMFPRKVYFKRRRLYRKIYTHLNKKSFFLKFFQNKGIHLRKPKIFLKFFLDTKRNCRSKRKINLTYFLQKNINTLFLKNRLKASLSSWKYKKQKTLLWNALKKKFNMKRIKSKKKFRILVKKKKRKIRSKKSKKFRILVKKKKRKIRSKKSKKFRILVKKKKRKIKRLVFNGFFKKNLITDNWQIKKFVNLPKSFKINFRLKKRQQGRRHYYYYYDRLKLNSAIRPIEEIENWEKKELQRQQDKKKYKQILRKNLNKLLLYEFKRKAVKNYYHPILDKKWCKLKKLHIARKKKYFFLKKMYNPKLQSYTNKRLVGKIAKFYELEKWYSRRRSLLKRQQREIRCIKKKNNIFNYRVLTFKKINLKRLKKKNLKVTVVSKINKRQQLNYSILFRKSWKKENCYAIKRFNKFFLYFLKPNSNNKIFLKQLNQQKLKIKRRARRPRRLHYRRTKKRPKKVDIFYHWFWGFRRFQRIHKMISNIKTYKDTFFRDYRKAKETYCLKYSRVVSMAKRSRDLINMRILKQIQFFKLLFYFFYKKKSVDTKNLFFFSRHNEYSFLLKKLYFSIKQKQIWLMLYQASKFFFNIKLNQKIYFNKLRLSHFNKSKILLYYTRVDKCKYYGLNFIKDLMKKNYLKINFFLIFKKKKFFLIKYLNLIYSLKLSTLFVTTINCFFISCFLLFQKNEHVFKKIIFDRVERYSHFRHLPIYLMQRFAFIFLLSLKFKQFFLFLEYIKFLFLKYSRKQFIIMTFYKLFLKSNFFNYLSNVVGFQFSLKGKMNRRPRARKILFFKKNRPAFQSLNLKIHYYAKHFTNYFGTFTVKFWLYYY